MIHDTLYSDKFHEISEIYKLDTNEVEVESESEVINLQGQGWSQVSSIQIQGQNGTSPDPQKSINKTQEVAAGANSQEVSDLRPHYFDPVMKETLLVDSGSQVTAVPPDPGDVEDKAVRLKAVNGTVIKTFGFKKISLKISLRTVRKDVLNVLAAARKQNGRRSARNAARLVQKQLLLRAGET